jgi:hypothetical protein
MYGQNAAARKTQNPTMVEVHYFHFQHDRHLTLISHASQAHVARSKAWCTMMHVHGMLQVRS